MKHLVTTLLFAIAGKLAFSQCTIDNVPTSPGIYPAILPAGCVGMNYDQSTTFVFPADTVISGFTLPLDSIILTVSNLPAGLTSVCQNPDCMTICTPPTLPRACIQVSGIPSTATSMGNTINVDATIYVTFPIVGAQAITTPLVVGLDIYDQPNVSVTSTQLGLTANSLIGTFQWLDCDNNMAPIAGETNAFFAPSASGNYAVSVTVASGCSDTSACTAFNTGAGLTESTNALFNIYPNPLKEQFSVTLKAPAESVSVAIYAANGQLVTTSSYANISSFEGMISGNPGIYYMEVTADGKTSRTKLVKR